MRDLGELLSRRRGILTLSFRAGQLQLGQLRSAPTFKWTGKSLATPCPYLPHDPSVSC